MSSEKMREEFEAWFEANKNFMLGTRKVSKGDCFFIWQASRAAVVVELPAELPSVPWNAPANSWNDALRKSRYAIEAAGLKVKS
jgi:hypothetical protein